VIPQHTKLGDLANTRLCFLRRLTAFCAPGATPDRKRLHMSIVPSASHRRLALVASVVALGTVVAGCANDGGGLFQTGAVSPAVAPVAAAPATPRVDPVCVSLGQQIDALRKEGVATKVENAAAKKYKLTPADISKADQLNKANADFQTKCGPQLPAAQQTAAAPGQGTVVPATAAPAAEAKKAAAKAAPKAAPKAAAVQSGVTAVAPKQ
jgi:hypothetical protein